jgi:hypothetical protein
LSPAEVRVWGLRGDEDHWPSGEADTGNSGPIKLSDPSLKVKPR